LLFLFSRIYCEFRLFCKEKVIAEKPTTGPEKSENRTGRSMDGGETLATAIGNETRRAEESTAETELSPTIYFNKYYRILQSCKLGNFG
jgi:hypothetical protein